MIDIKRIFARAEDKNVCNNLFYIHTDNYIYYAADHAKKVEADVLLPLLKKGLVVMTNAAGIMYNPVSYKVDAADHNCVVVTYVKADTTTATTAVLTLAYTKEHA